MDWQGKKILVTGSRGLIGVPLVRMLRAAGADVHEFDLSISSDHNITNPNAIAAEIGYFLPDFVFNLAAYSIVEIARERPLDCWAVNFMGTVNVLEAVRQHVPDSIVMVASSNHVYGKQEHLPVKEDAELREYDTYTATKTALEIAAHSYYSTYGVKSCIIRNTNCFGEFDPHDSHIIPASIKSVLDGKPMVLRSSGQSRKGYLFADDVALAYIVAAAAMVEHQLGHITFNVGSEPVSPVEVYEMVCALMGAAPNLVVGGDDYGQFDEHLDDRLLRSFGWYPSHTLAQGLEKAIAAFKERHAARV